MITMEFREFRKEDTPALEGIIRKTWNYDKFAGPKNSPKACQSISKQLSCQSNLFSGSCGKWQTCGNYSWEKILPFINGPLSYRWKQNLFSHLPLPDKRRAKCLRNFLAV